MLKDHFIFSVMVREIQEHLLNEIEDDYNLNQSLQEARETESCIAQKICWVSSRCSMTPLVREIGAGLRKNQS